MKKSKKEDILYRIPEGYEVQSIGDPEGHIVFSPIVVKKEIDIEGLFRFIDITSTIFLKGVSVGSILRLTRRKSSTKSILYIKILSNEDSQFSFKQGINTGFINYNRLIKLHKVDVMTSEDSINFEVSKNLKTLIPIEKPKPSNGPRVEVGDFICLTSNSSYTNSEVIKIDAGGHPWIKNKSGIDSAITRNPYTLVSKKPITHTKSDKTTAIGSLGDDLILKNLTYDPNGNKITYHNVDGETKEFIIPDSDTIEEAEKSFSYNAKLVEKDDPYRWKTYGSKDLLF